MKIGLFLAGVGLFSLASCNGKNQNITQNNEPVVQVVDSMKARIRQLAFRDFDLNQCKYYFNTLSIAPQKFVENAAVYNVQVVTKNCTPDPEELVYNQLVDSLVHANHKVRISDLIP